ncbi:MAG: 50S ribosomal protein L25/general stress protein Ctc [Gammaproteobacteria bacterium]|nr:50S ribosomal protein L25/general stress protein Ctc [Gammaproteobacteria bacterium]
MSSSFLINAEMREDLGKGASRRLRHAGKVPAIIYGFGGEPVSITLEHSKIIHNLEEETFYSQILEVSLDGKIEKVVLRDLQRHPAKPVIMHMDFQRVNENEAMHVHIPLHFIGEDICPGVKLESGAVSHQTTEVEISCLPKDLIEFIEVDVSALNVGDSIHLTDLKLPEGVSLVALSHGEGHDQTVVTVHVTKTVEVEEGAPEAPSNDVEGEEEGEGDSE